MGCCLFSGECARSSVFECNLFVLFAGAKQSGVALNHVVLPTWAKGDPREFIRAHREVSRSHTHTHTHTHTHPHTHHTLTHTHTHHTLTHTTHSHTHTHAPRSKLLALTGNSATRALTHTHAHMCTHAHTHARTEVEVVGVDKELGEVEELGDELAHVRHVVFGGGEPALLDGVEHAVSQVKMTTLQQERVCESLMCVCVCVCVCGVCVCTCSRRKCCVVVEVECWVCVCVCVVCVRVSGYYVCVQVPVVGGSVV